MSTAVVNRRFGGNDHRGRAKPTAGQATRAEGIVAMRQAGQTPREIADQLGISLDTVQACLAHSPAALRAEGILDPNAAGRIIHRSTEPELRRTIEIRLSDSEFAALVRIARAQCITPAQAAAGAVREAIAAVGEVT